MKRVYLLPVLIFVISSALYCQDQCAVLLKGIADRYEGACKNGLADGEGEAWGTDHYRGSFRKGLPHGKGTYNYADGSVYVGTWARGLRQGEGRLTFRSHGADSIREGVWKNDEYSGKVPEGPGYKLIMSRAIERYRVYRYSDGNEIRVLLKPITSGSLEVSNLQIIGSSGYESEFLNSQMEFKNCDYPFRLRVTFNKWSKLKTMRVDATIELEILRPGVWLVEIGA